MQVSHAILVKQPLLASKQKYSSCTSAEKDTGSRSPSYAGEGTSARGGLAFSSNEAMISA